MKTSNAFFISLHIFTTIIALVAIICNQRDVAKEAIKILSSSNIGKKGKNLDFDSSNTLVLSHQSGIKKLLSCYSSRLQKLKEQRALQGLTTDPSILIEIENIEKEIIELGKIV